jgi:hypothetical protein
MKIYENRIKIGARFSLFLEAYTVTNRLSPRLWIVLAVIQDHQDPCVLEIM